MSYRTVASAQQAVWPKVRESLRLHRASRAAAARGEALSNMEKRDARKSMEHIAANETVWAIAKADLLNSPEQAAVLRAARVWAKAIGPYLINEPHNAEPEEHELYRAVQELATDPSEISGAE